MTSKKLVKIIANLMLDKKAIDIMIIKVDKLTTLTDYFINCSSNSDPQTKAIKDHIYKNLSKNKIKPINIEGFENLKWVLLDYVDVVVNVFNKEQREYYNIERLWSDAKIETIKESQ